MISVTAQVFLGIDKRIFTVNWYSLGINHCHPLILLLPRPWINSILLIVCYKFPYTLRNWCLIKPRTKYDIFLLLITFLLSILWGEISFLVTFGRKKVHLTIIRVHHDSRRYHKAEERLGTKTRIRKYKSRRKLCKVMITRRPRAFNSSKSETPLLAPSRIATTFSWRNYLHIRTCKFSSYIAAWASH